MVLQNNQSVELVVDAKATLGEGPSWDAVNKVLYWVDIIEHKLHIHNPITKDNRTIHIGKFIGAVVPRKRGGVVLALHDGFYALDLHTEKLTLLAKADQEPYENRFNDGKCDAAGNFIAGTMPLEGLDPKGSLYCLNPSLQVNKLFDGVICSNGLAWSSDQSTLYYIDSPTKVVVAYDYDLDHASVSNKRVVIQILEREGVPDGMTIDSEGMLWVAQWDGYKVSRWNPHTGERLEVIPLPAARVTSCVFAGEDLNDLYITTARIGLTESQLHEQPHAGGLFKLKTQIKGTITEPFGG